jgi:uncharacterized membrane protein (DUF441 family)
MESWLFLGVILLIAVVAKNQSLVIATLAILVLKGIPHSEKFLSILNKQGINWGVTLISATILVPIATGDIVLKDLLNTLKSPLGWIATICGVLVAVLSSKGVGLINHATDPSRHKSLTALPLTIFGDSGGICISETSLVR